MKLMICDKCGSTDKPIGKAQIMTEGETIITDSIGLFTHESIEGIDLCDICYDTYIRMSKSIFNIQIFVGKF